MFLVDSKSSKFLILLTELALWLAELLKAVFGLDKDRVLEATDAGRGFDDVLWQEELIAVEARRLAKFTCWAEADLVDNRSKVLDIGR